MASAPDTIFALSSGRPPAAIAVVRMSGPQAGEALRALIGRVPEPRRAALARLRDPASREIIDEALALWFPAPRSETGEDVVELQLHGGRAVIAATLAALGQIEGLRPAEAGEFTRRAFANGKLDLTKVEGLADLIAAETEGQRRQALRQLQGLLGDKVDDWRRRLIEALALTEAGIDFADEDLPGNLLPQVRAIAQALADEIAAVLDDGRRGERLRDGLVVAIAGPPNAGKSTLLNRLAGRDAAIVSPYAGTTRDAIEVHLDLGGCPVTLVDTAGIRETRDPVEREGVNRALARAEAADLVLWVVDATDPAPAAPPSGGRPTWLIRNKIDLCEVGATRGDARPGDPGFGPEHPSQFAPEHPLRFGSEHASRASVDVAAHPPTRAALARARARALEGEARSTDPRLDLGEGEGSATGSQSASPVHPTPPPSRLRFAAPVGVDPPPLGEGGTESAARAEPTQTEYAPAVRDEPIRNARPIRDGLNQGRIAARDEAIQTAPPLDELHSPANNESMTQYYITAHTISAVRGDGFTSLLAGLTEAAGTSAGEPALITRHRHRQALQEAHQALLRALRSAGEEILADEILAEELRLAARALGRLTGRVDVEDVLEVIFREFCVGK